LASRHEGGVQHAFSPGLGNCGRTLHRYFAAFGQDFKERVKAAVRTIVRWEGGDHVGPHGYPCRRCHPFPYLLYYQIDAGVLCVLGLVHERRHPNYLKKRLGESSDPSAE
jgi:hypothetical protein